MRKKLVELWEEILIMICIIVFIAIIWLVPDKDEDETYEEHLY